MKTKSYARSWVVAVAVISITSAGQAQVHPDDENMLDHNFAGKTIQVVGHVVDTAGDPIQNAQVVAYVSGYSRSARPSGVQISNVLPMTTNYAKTVRTDAKGSFSTQIVVRDHGPYTGIGVVASAPLHGIGRAGMNLKDAKQKVEIRLSDEHLIRGRVVDLKGQPAVGAKVRIVEWGTKYPLGKLDPWNQVTTDDKGRFLLRGLNDREYRVEFMHEKLAAHQEKFQAVPTASKEKVTVAVATAHTIYGTVTYENSGNPVANAVVMAPQGDFGPLWQMTRTDAKGRYRINPYPPGEETLGQPKSYFLNVFPPNDEPLLVSRIIVPISRAKSQEVNVTLKEVAVVVGRVTDEENRPIEGARVQYRPKNPGHDRIYMTAPTEASQVQVAITKQDGSYELGVPAGEGELLVLAPTLDFISVETLRGHYRLYADAIASLSLSSGRQALAQDFQLRRGVTLKGRVTGDDGMPVESFELISQKCLASGYQPEISDRCSNGYFELHGCDPELTYNVTLLDKENQRGAAIVMSAKHAKQPADVRLQSFGSAAIAFEDDAGQPTAAKALLSIVLREGAPHRFYLNVKQGTAPPEGLFQHIGGDRSSDEGGRLLFEDLIPGADYMIRWQPGLDGMRSPEPWPHVRFSVKSGEKLDLGTKVAVKSGF